MTTPEPPSLSPRFSPDCALAIARVVHHGQTDKAGESYIGHVLRVMGRLEDDQQRIVAALHDVLEDGPKRGWPITPDHLRAAGVPPEALAAVVTITHPRGEADEPYWARVLANPLARAVKLADIADNSDPERLARLKPSVRDRLVEKYTKARTALSAGEQRIGRTRLVDQIQASSDGVEDFDE